MSVAQGLVFGSSMLRTVFKQYHQVEDYSDDRIIYNKLMNANHLEVAVQASLSSHSIKSMNTIVIV